MHNELDTIDKQSSFLLHFSFFSVCCSPVRLLAIWCRVLLFLLLLVFFCRLPFLEVFIREVWVSLCDDTFSFSAILFGVRGSLASIWRSNSKFQWRVTHDVRKRRRWMKKSTASDEHNKSFNSLGVYVLSGGSLFVPTYKSSRLSHTKTNIKLQPFRCYSGDLQMVTQLKFR